MADIRVQIGMRALALALTARGGEVDVRRLPRLLMDAAAELGRDDSITEAILAFAENALVAGSGGAREVVQVQGWKLMEALAKGADPLSDCVSDMGLAS